MRKFLLVFFILFLVSCSPSVLNNLEDLQNNDIIKTMFTSTPIPTIIPTIKPTPSSTPDPLYTMVPLSYLNSLINSVSTPTPTPYFIEPTIEPTVYVLPTSIPTAIPTINPTPIPTRSLPPCPNITPEQQILNSLYSVDEQTSYIPNVNCVEVTNFTASVVNINTYLVMPNVIVKIDDKVTTTDENGIFSFNNITLGFHKIVFEMIGYEPTELTTNVKKNTSEASFNINLTKIESTEYSPTGSCWVNSYFRSDGTYVSGYYRSCPTSSSSSTSYSSGSSGSCWVSGYTRKNGTYVSGYYRSCR